MLDPPSEQLQRLLAEYKLATSRDLRRCRSRVRRLAHDLPAFDSVWIDALVQTRRLTSFQARVLGSARPEALRVGPCVLVNQLGRGPAARTYLARRMDGHELCVLKRVAIGTEELTATWNRVQDLVAAAGRFSHPSAVVPHVCKRLEPAVRDRLDLTAPGMGDDPDLVLLSRFVPGLTLSELMVRRGRLPASVVIEVGRQLLEAMAALEEHGLVHGEILLSNVRLTRAGVAVLVDAGIGLALRPNISLHAQRPPEAFDGVAPERIGTRQQPTVHSDLYALGCLLWQMLAGRPPFPAGDALAKLAAHQTQVIPDIREWTPDTPAWLADRVSSLTASDATDRPLSAQEALECWGKPGRLGQRRVRRFRALFDSGVPRVPPPSNARSSNRWTVLVALIFMLSGGVLSLMDQGARTEVLAWTTHISDWLHRQTGQDTPVPRLTADRVGVAPDGAGLATGALLPLPAPSVEGIVLLDSSGPYAAADIATAGSLVIRGADGMTPEILVHDTPMRVWAEELLFENVTLRRAANASGAESSEHPAPEPPALLLIRAQNLSVDRCRFETGSPDAARASSTAETPRSVALAWKPLEPNGARAQFVSLQNTVFLGCSPSVYLGGVPQKLSVVNCLKLQPGSLVNVAGEALVARTLHFSLQHSTLRQSGPLLRILWPRTADNGSVPSVDGVSCHILVEATECIFDLMEDRAALFEWLADPVPHELVATITMRGGGSLIAPGTTIAAAVDATTGERTALDSAALQLEGLMAAPFSFVGPAGRKPGDSAIGVYDAPRLSTTPPGIDPSRLLPATESPNRSVPQSRSIEAQDGE